MSRQFPRSLEANAAGQGAEDVVPPRHRQPTPRYTAAELLRLWRPSYGWLPIPKSIPVELLTRKCKIRVLAPLVEHWTRTRRAPHAHRRHGSPGRISPRAVHPAPVVPLLDSTITSLLAFPGEGGACTPRLPALLSTTAAHPPLPGPAEWEAALAAVIAALLPGEDTARTAGIGSGSTAVADPSPHQRFNRTSQPSCSDASDPTLLDHPPSNPLSKHPSGSGALPGEVPPLGGGAATEPGSGITALTIAACGSGALALQPVQRVLHAAGLAFAAGAALLPDQVGVLSGAVYNRDGLDDVRVAANMATARRWLLSSADICHRHLLQQAAPDPEVRDGPHPERQSLAVQQQRSARTAQCDGADCRIEDLDAAGDAIQWPDGTGHAPASDEASGMQEGAPLVRAANTSNAADDQQSRLSSNSAAPSAPLCVSVPFDPVDAPAQLLQTDPTAPSTIPEGVQRVAAVLAASAHTLVASTYAVDMAEQQTGRAFSNTMRTLLNSLVTVPSAEDVHSSSDLYLYSGRYDNRKVQTAQGAFGPPGPTSTAPRDGRAGAAATRTAEHALTGRQSPALHTHAFGGMGLSTSGKGVSPESVEDALFDVVDEDFFFQPPDFAPQIDSTEEDVEPFGAKDNFADLVASIASSMRVEEQDAAAILKDSVADEEVEFGALNMSISGHRAAAVPLEDASASQQPLPVSWSESPFFPTSMAVSKASASPQLPTTAVGNTQSSGAVPIPSSGSLMVANQISVHRLRFADHLEAAATVLELWVQHALDTASAVGYHWTTRLSTIAYCARIKAAKVRLVVAAEAVASSAQMTGHIGLAFTQCSAAEHNLTIASWSAERANGPLGSSVRTELGVPASDALLCKLHLSYILGCMASRLALSVVVTGKLPETISSEPIAPLSESMSPLCASLVPWPTVPEVGFYAASRFFTLLGREIIEKSGFPSTLLPASSFAALNALMDAGLIATTAVAVGLATWLASPLGKCRVSKALSVLSSTRDHVASLQSEIYAAVRRGVEHYANSNEPSSPASSTYSLPRSVSPIVPVGADTRDAFRVGSTDSFGRRPHDSLMGHSPGSWSLGSFGGPLLPTHLGATPVGTLSSPGLVCLYTSPVLRCVLDVVVAALRCQHLFADGLKFAAVAPDGINATPSSLLGPTGGSALYKYVKSWQICEASDVLHVSSDGRVALRDTSTRFSVISSFRESLAEIIPSPSGSCGMYECTAPVHEHAEASFADGFGGPFGKLADSRGLGESLGSLGSTSLQDSGRFQVVHTSCNVVAQLYTYQTLHYLCLLHALCLGVIEFVIPVDLSNLSASCTSESDVEAHRRRVEARGNSILELERSIVALCAAAVNTCEKAWTLASSGNTAVNIALYSQTGVALLGMFHCLPSAAQKARSLTTAKDHLQKAFDMGIASGNMSSHPGAVVSAVFLALVALYKSFRHTIWERFLHCFDSLADNAVSGTIHPTETPGVGSVDSIRGDLQGFAADPVPASMPSRRTKAKKPLSADVVDALRTARRLLLSVLPFVAIASEHIKIAMQFHVQPGRLQELRSESASIFLPAQRSQAHAILSLLATAAPSTSLLRGALHAVPHLVFSDLMIPPTLAVFGAAYPGCKVPLVRAVGGATSTVVLASTLICTAIVRVCLVFLDVAVDAEHFPVGNMQVNFESAASLRRLVKEVATTSASGLLPPAMAPGLAAAALNCLAEFPLDSGDSTPAKPVS